MAGHAGMDHGSMDHGNMNTGTMDHSAMGHDTMGHGGARHTMPDGTVMQGMSHDAHAGHGSGMQMDKPDPF